MEGVLDVCRCGEHEEEPLEQRVDIQKRVAFEV